MDLQEIIYNRRSIRKYKDISITKEQIDEIIRAGIVAPSGKNKQPWRFKVYAGSAKQGLLQAMNIGIQKEIEGEGLLPNSRFGLADAMNTLRIMKTAPAIILIFDEEFDSPFQRIAAEKHVTELVNTLSIGAAVENMLLKATDMGMGTLWICNTFYAYQELRAFTGTDMQLLAAVAVGYPKEAPEARPRKKLEEVVEYYME